MEPRWLSLTTVALGLNQIDKLSSCSDWFNGRIVLKPTEVRHCGVAFCDLYPWEIPKIH